MKLSVPADLSPLETELANKTDVGHTHAASDITSGTIGTARLGSGTADSTTFLRGDGTWTAPPEGVTHAQVLARGLGC